MKPRDKYTWPRAVCPHCGKDRALGPKSGRFTRHNCSLPCCRPADLNDYVRLHQESGCWNWDDAMFEVCDVGFPCPMSGEVADQ
jgi:hypothetical protein